MKLDTTMTVGCDLGDRKSDLCVLDATGAVVERERIATSRRGFRKAFEGHSTVRIVLEAGTHSAWAAMLLTELGHEVVVANPRRVQLIAKGHVKSDSVDAELLARLGRVDVDLLSPIQHRGRQAQLDLATVRGRAELVETRTKLINHVRGVVKAHGHRLPKCSTAAFVKKVEPVLPEVLSKTLAPQLAVIGAVTEQIKGLDHEIAEEMPKRYPEMIALQTIDCIGPLTALTFVLTIDDPNRFSRSRSVGAYLGMCPRRRQSGKGDPELRITKCGDRYLRCLLVNCAQRMLSSFGQDSDLRRWGLALEARGKKAAHQRAVVAVARRLSVLMHRIMITGEVWQPFDHGRAQAA